MSVLKIKLTLSFCLLLSLAACNKKERFTYWTDRTDNLIQRLNEAMIKYEIREGEIWVFNKDLEKVVACWY
jgi:hypothetical protein